MFLEFQDGVADVPGDILGKSALIDVTGFSVQHSRIFNIGKMDPFADDIYFYDLVSIDFLYLELNCGSGLSLHPVRALLARQSVG